MISMKDKIILDILFEEKKRNLHSQALKNASVRLGVPAATIEKMYLDEDLREQYNNPE
jgi:hypothetical protein